MDKYSSYFLNVRGDPLWFIIYDLVRIMNDYSHGIDCVYFVNLHLMGTAMFINGYLPISHQIHGKRSLYFIQSEKHVGSF